MDLGDEDLELQAAISCKGFPGWVEAISYTKGQKVQFEGSGFEVAQSHFSVKGAGWTPKAAASLFTNLGTCTDGAVDNGGGAQQPAPAPAPAPTPPPNNGGGGIGAGGVFDANIRDLVDERFFIIKISQQQDPSFNFTQVTNVGRAGMQDIKSLIASGAGKVTVNGDEVTVTVGNERRLQIRRNKAAGLIEGVMVGAASDLKAPFVMRLRVENGVLTHTLICDVSNNQKNDLFGKAPVNNQVVETGGADFGKAGIPGIFTLAEAREVVSNLKFPGLKGF